MLLSSLIARGKAPAVPAGMRVYAVGDVHGRSDLLDVLLAMIAEDAATSAADRRVVVFLGDYVDRGADSRGVVDRLAAGPPEGFAWVCLRGNHEDMMLSFMADRSLGPAWMRNGGLPTLTSYLGPEAERMDLAELQRALIAALPTRHLEFLKTLSLTHYEGDYLFVHAGVRPGVALSRQSPADLLWIRDPFLDSQASHGKVVVHGHSIDWRPVERPNRIGIDTGAFTTGHLTALALEGTRRAFLQT